MKTFLKKLSGKIFPIVLLICFCSLLKMEGANEASKPIETGKVQIEKLSSWSLSATDSIDLNLDGKHIAFFPQSFGILGNQILFLNRFIPSFVTYSLEKRRMEKLVFLKHPADKKFEACFFIDLVLTSAGIFGLEQSSGSLRKASESGEITNVYFCTETLGSIITRVWQINENEFAFLDEGHKKLLIRDISDGKLNEAPDKNGRSIEIGKAEIMCNSQGFVVLEKKKDASWLATWRTFKDGKSIPMATWKCEKVIPLDSDERNFYFFVDDGKQPLINKFSGTSGAFIQKSFVCPKLIFSKNITRHALIAGENKLYLLLSDETELSLQELNLQ
ncbi:MAG: hypothetical protein HQM08_23755 [Candidatus Riflebacteria bacterium]|nr:hypothetical protein [Candidatus Riflebacteria bacterium]